MKAQEKPETQVGQGAAKDKKTNGSAATTASPAKKRKVDVKEEPESEREEVDGDEDDGEDAKQLHQSLKGFDEDGEKV